eukprot:52189_1
MKMHITTEQQNLLKFKEEIDDPNISKIVLLGITGHGKSTFGNRLCGNIVFETSDALDSETQEIKKVTIKPNINNINNKISVIDTPGNFDSHGTDRRHANNLVEYLKGCGGINAFIIVKSYTVSRYDVKFKQYLCFLSKMLGTNFWTHVSVILTHASYNHCQTQEFEKYCKQFNQQIKLDQNLDKDVNIPIIGIDNYDKKENYLKQINKLLHIIKPIAYQCNALKS